jgi:hypothetical protein
MKRDRFFHILRFQHFTDNKNQPDMTDKDSDRLWKMRRLGLGVTTILWRYKRDVCILTNIHDTPAGCNFCNTNGKAIKLQIVADYNRHMGCV